MLRDYVSDQGLVNYRELAKNRAPLDAYVKSLGQVSERTFASWSRGAQIAFLINAYNAFTLRVIIDHYPIQAGGFSALVYPKNSIRQIPGAWTGIEFELFGKKTTLDAIEHKMLRQGYHEPRVHMALVCAAMGCPKLRNVPYAGDRLDAQLDDQAKTFLANPKKFRIDYKQHEVFLSPIFKWFGKDFVRSYKNERPRAGLSEEENSVLHFIEGYITEKEARALASEKLSIRYLDYDWSLNEQREGR